MTARGYITADARNQTAYGTVRAYIAVGLSTGSLADVNAGNINAANTFSANRAFIQWAGFTMGLSQSFYDFYSTAATAYWGDYPASDTGDPGWHVFAYTAQFGNGFSATISAEDARRSQIIGTDSTSAAPSLGGAVAGCVPGRHSWQQRERHSSGQGAYGGAQAPDVVGNLRVDQAWGGAQVMAAWHDVNSAYYGTGALQLGRSSSQRQIGLGRRWWSQTERTDDRRRVTTCRRKSTTPKVQRAMPSGTRTTTGAPAMGNTGRLVS